MLDFASTVEFATALNIETTAEILELAPADQEAARQGYGASELFFNRPGDSAAATDILQTRYAEPSDIAAEAGPAAPASRLRSSIRVAARIAPTTAASGRSEMIAGLVD